MSIEKILQKEGKKLEERTNIKHPVIINIPFAGGIFKYKIGEIIMPNGGNSKFMYVGLSEDGYDFRYIPKDEIIQ